MTPKTRERLILLKRFVREDVDIYRLGEQVGLERVHKYREEFKRRQVSRGYFYIPYDEKDGILNDIADSISDEKLVDFFSNLKPTDWLGIGFKGQFYTYSEGERLTMRNASEDVKKDVLEALNQVGERGYALLKAIAELHDLGKWIGDYYGATYADILAQIRKLCGKPLLPAPRDFPILASYRIYYKSGSRKHPTHSIPEERIDSVKEALEQWMGLKGH